MKDDKTKNQSDKKQEQSKANECQIPIRKREFYSHGPSGSPKKTNKK